MRVGISPKGERIGVRTGKGTIEDLANKIKINTDPPLFPSITVEGTEDSAVINFHIEESPIKPVWAFGGPVKRVGCTNQHLSRGEAQRMTEVTTGRTWDALPCKGFAQSDLSRASIQDFLERAQLPRTPSAKLVKNLSLETSEGRFSTAAVLLFGKNPQQYFPEAQIKCARFKGDSSVTFIDEKTFDGNIISQLDNALAFVTCNTREEFRITGRAERETIPEYPTEAVREAITNAICHRDYSAVGTVQIRIYDNSMEVWNPGKLPADFPIETLFKKHPSRPHNPKIAQALYRARLIEHWGTGTLRIFEACRKGGVRLKILSETGQFKVLFLKKKQRALPSGKVESRLKSRLKSQIELQLKSLRTKTMEILETGPTPRGKFRGSWGRKCHRDNSIKQFGNC